MGQVARNTVDEAVGIGMTPQTPEARPLTAEEEAELRRDVEAGYYNNRIITISRLLDTLDAARAATPAAPEALREAAQLLDYIHEAAGTIRKAAQDAHAALAAAPDPVAEPERAVADWDGGVGFISDREVD